MRSDATTEQLQCKDGPLHRSVQPIVHAGNMIERERAGHELVRYTEQLRVLSQLLVAAREDERQRLARELHDRVGQNLTALDLDLNIICGALPPDVFAHVSARLSECLRLVQDTMAIVADVMTELHSGVAGDCTLMAALRWQAEQFSQHTGVPVYVSGREPAPRLSSALESALLRIAQEALTNASKYAHGSQAALTLESSAECVRMIVADDGCGFDPSAIPPDTGRRGWGLEIMRERAEAVGARFQIESRLGKGSRVIVEIRR
jgi:signal transduction histidine kinase